MFEEVLLSGGSRVSILPESIYLTMGLGKLEPTPFQVKMADQRRVESVGILRNSSIQISGMQFHMNFLFLKMKEGDTSYVMLFGRPWFRLAKVKHDWGGCTYYRQTGDHYTYARKKTYFW